ncbi:hypothetical protein [Luteipulveratus mongoliensis]|uniref:Uncharacterized protein n=1 Tax=Luteipulveratus mongoliensis TaxID=571913 RepID=A0A0K1JE26_9MICO|nr:hypothetical protein [Luteipulveratus mongoliensis]AKU14840.1 hypothetical protein VV02_01425 [Luteipulveratus mongoliensis]
MPTKTTRTRKAAPKASIPRTAAYSAPTTEVAPDPHPLSDAELQLMAGDASTADAAADDAYAPEPTMQPPGTAVAAGYTAATAAAAITGQKVTALWAEQTNRNAQIHLQTAGWKKLGRQTDSGSTVLTLLAAHAQSSGIAPVAQEDPPGSIMSMYVW